MNGTNTPLKQCPWYNNNDEYSAVLDNLNVEDMFSSCNEKRCPYYYKQQGKLRPSFCDKIIYSQKYLYALCNDLSNNVNNHDEYLPDTLINAKEAILALFSENESLKIELEEMYEGEII